jgi:hypothetical protein
VLFSGFAAVEKFMALVRVIALILGNKRVKDAPFLTD